MLLMVLPLKVRVDARDECVEVTGPKHDVIDVFLLVAGLPVRMTLCFIEGGGALNYATRTFAEDKHLTI